MSITMAERGIPLILLDTDLFFVVKVRTMLQHAGYDVRTARTLADFTQRLTAGNAPALALVNTAIAGVDWRAAIVAAREANIPVIAFGSHVDLETQQEARRAGATRVIANSRLAADLPGIVARALQAPAQPSDTPDTTNTSERSPGNTVSAGSDAPQQEASPPEARQS